MHCGVLGPSQAVSGLASLPHGLLTDSISDLHFTRLTKNTPYAVFLGHQNPGWGQGGSVDKMLAPQA